MLVGLLLSGRTGKLGGGVIVLVIVGFLAFSFLGGGGRRRPGVRARGRPASASPAARRASRPPTSRGSCRSGKDANRSLDCAIVADVNSIQGYWSGGGYAALASTVRGAAPRYEPSNVTFFSGQVRTRCGSADASAGPFYCPGDDLVYIDLSFYDQLRQQFGAQGGPLVNAYVLAHEYGHHVQDLLGTEAAVRTREGATSDSVRLEPRPTATPGCG